MRTRFVPPSRIPDILKEYMPAPDAVFVFPSDIASDSWSDWAVRNPEKSGTKAVALERFIAWDFFKSRYAVASEKGASSVPSLLRKLFVCDLTEKNAAAAAAGRPLLKSLVSPDFARNAGPFTDWIAGILPSLDLWHRKYSAWLAAQENGDGDEENQDYLFLYERYKSFLEENGLFEPSWYAPDFAERERTFVIFYPETLEDFFEYEEAFAACDNIVAVRLPDGDTSRPPAVLYQDSRSELRQTALLIRRLVRGRKASWDEIAVSVGDLEAYRPYIEREFRSYGIPFVVRAGIPFTRNCAGSVFRLIRECRRSRFSYDSVRALLLDGYVPWRERQVNENLVREGSRMRCICGYEDGGKTVDVWTEAFGRAEGARSERERRMYGTLREDVIRLCDAPDFAGVRKAWFVFKTHFLAEDGFSPDADRILGRCLSVLDDLIRIEEKYAAPAGLAVRAPFDFFLNELETGTYRPQEKSAGVSVFPYRLAACADFKYQIVMNASQKALTVPFRRLGFLNDEKRRALKIEDSDTASRAFIRLYAKYGCGGDPRSGSEAAASGRASESGGDAAAENTAGTAPAAALSASGGRNGAESGGGTFFSASEQTLSGFAIAHSFLEAAPAARGQDADDFILRERAWFLSGAGAENAPQAFTPRQKSAFRRWSLCAREDGAAAGQAGGAESGRGRGRENPRAGVSAPVAERIRRQLYEKGGCAAGLSAEDGAAAGQACGAENPPLMRISQTDMKSFFPCPRRWLFRNALRLREDTLDTDLMRPYDAGNIKHRILELVMRRFLNDGGLIPCVSDGGAFEDERAVRGVVEDCAELAFRAPDAEFRDSPLVMTALESQKENFTDEILSFLKKFCRRYDGKGGFGGCRVKAVENWYSAGTAGREYFGRIDCLLADDSGALSVIDYKSNDTPDRKDCLADADGRLGDFQMAMYVALLDAQNPSPADGAAESGGGEKGAPDGAPAHCAAAPAGGAENALFYSIRREKPVYILCGADEKLGRGNFRATLEALEKYAERFYERAGAGDFSPRRGSSDPYNSVDVYEDCMKCQFKTICRTAYIVAGRSVGPQTVTEAEND